MLWIILGGVGVLILGVFLGTFITYKYSNIRTVKTWDELLKVGTYNGDEITVDENHEALVNEMKDFCGKTVNIDNVLTGYLIRSYTIKEDKGKWIWQDWQFK